MNEIAPQASIRIPPARKSKLRIVTLFDVDAAGVALAARKVLALNPARRNTIHQAARNFWLQTRIEFEQNLEQLAKMIQQKLNAPP